MSKFGNKIEDVTRFGKLTSDGADGSKDDCWVKFDVSSEGDVTGEIKKEGDIYVCRLKYTAKVKWDCQCGPCDLPEQKEDVYYSMLWGDPPGPQGGPHRQHDVRCVPDNNTKNSSKGTLKGPFRFIYCVKTDKECYAAENWAGCGGGGEADIEKEVIIPWTGATTAFCNIGPNPPSFYSGAIAEGLKTQIDGLGRNSIYFQCR